jgi:hypothetical protein
MADLNRELEARCSGADVSVKNEEALADPSPLISTFEMIRSPTVVWGDSRIVSALGDIDIADVPKTESLTLIHNRVTESLLFHPVPGSAQEDRKEALRRLYATAKVMLDSITAYLFLRNNVPTGFGDRVRFFTDDVLRRPESAGLLGRLSPFLDELPAWARFKTTGDLEGVAESLGGTLDDAGLIGLANGAWYRCIPYVEALWRAILTDVARRDATVQDLSAVARLYGRLENPLRSALRTKGILEPGRAPEGLLSAPRAVARARYASTKALVYLTAVLVYLSFSDALEWRLAEKLILRYCPFRFPQGFSNRSDEEKRETLIQMLDAFHRHVLLGRREN